MTMAESKTNAPSLASKIATIGKEIGRVDKTGKNTQQYYNYIEYGEVAGRIRELFDKYKVAIIPQVKNRQVDVVRSSKGGVGYHYILEMEFTIVNGDNPEDRFVATWLGESADYGDKGVNKAETSATKYFLMRLFNVSEKGEKDADSESSDIGDSTPLAPPPKPKRPAVSMRDVSYAKDSLKQAKNLAELRTIYAALSPELKQNKEIIAYAGDLKTSLQMDEEIDEGTEVENDAGK